MQIKIREFVKLLKVDIEIDQFDCLEIIAAIYKSKDGKYSLDILRRDTYILNPSFVEFEKADESFYVFDSFFDIVGKSFDSIQELQENLVAEISERFTAQQ